MCVSARLRGIGGLRSAAPALIQPYAKHRRDAPRALESLLDLSFIGSSLRSDRKEFCSDRTARAFFIIIIFLPFF